jgi:fumarate reductase subunit C
MDEISGAAARSQQPMIKSTGYLPKAYRPRISTYWWLARWAYLKFILREISSVFVAWIVVVILLQIRAIDRGPAAYLEFQSWLRNPFVLALNIISVFFILFHAVTWFNLAPKAMVVRARGKRIPGAAIATSNYAAWVLISAAIAWIALRG